MTLGTHAYKGSHYKADSKETGNDHSVESGLTKCGGGGGIAGADCELKLLLGEHVYYMKRQGTQGVQVFQRHNFTGKYCEGTKRTNKADRQIQRSKRRCRKSTRFCTIVCTVYLVRVLLQNFTEKPRRSDSWEVALTELFNGLSARSRALVLKQREADTPPYGNWLTNQSLTCR